MSKKLVSLKRCPFCGGKADRIEIVGEFYVRCSNPLCRVRPHTEWYDRLTDATKAWNRRKGEQCTTGEKHK